MEDLKVPHPQLPVVMKMMMVRMVVMKMMLMKMMLMKVADGSSAGV